MLKKLIPLLLLILAGLAAVKYTKLTDSKKRFIKRMVGQVPYLPGRYLA